ncbi:MAG TPA: hypothetical protein VN926_12950, partial [Bradyrhizobium sp.]|nr:hypothetical protein [Bradyrhizobium sp.]
GFQVTRKMSGSRPRRLSAAMIAARSSARSQRNLTKATIVETGIWTTNRALRSRVRSTARDYRRRVEARVVRRAQQAYTAAPLRIALDGRLRAAQRHAVIPPSSIERLKPTEAVEKRVI